MLSDLLHEELSNEQILSTLKKASPSARLRFYADILPYIVPKAQEEALQYEPLNNIEIIVKRERDEADWKDDSDTMVGIAKSYLGGEWDCFLILLFLKKQ